MRESRLVPVPDGLDGMRLDAGVARMLGLSRTVVAGLADDGDVTVDGIAVGKSHRLAAGTMLHVTLPEPDEPLQIEPTPVEDLEVIYHDSDIVVVDKPVGVAAHPSLGWSGPTVIGALAAAGYRISTSGAHERHGIVHRLDVGTSGVMVVAVSERAYTILKRAFKQRTVDKGYHALVQGHLDPPSGTIDAPIGRHRGNDWRFAVTANGKPSITHYDTLEMFASASLLDVHLETGRTHQIRVHFSALHHPCCGDPTYGADPVLAKRLGLERQWLHARSLAFAHPADGRRVEFTSDYPADLQHALDVLRAT
ncbi:RluA family pseudouridine synthase [Gordonia sp. NPDC003585]|uniref:RluA family pseudouridine synthase n=1 Tax=Gordonia sp. NPDC003585 TaxID=3154275 RepID=UPI0033B0E0F8